MRVVFFCTGSLLGTMLLVSMGCEEDSDLSIESVASPQSGELSDVGELAADGFGPSAPPNPALGEGGAKTMHGDSVSSDTTPRPGPGLGKWKAGFRPMFGACPTVLIRSDGYPMTLCTAWIGRNPTVRILHPRTSLPLAKLKLAAGSLLGGVYAYLDNRDRLVMVDGEQNLIRVAAKSQKRLFRTTWKLVIDESVSLTQAVTDHCGGGDCDAVVSISPDGDGAVWFATRGGVVGIHDPATGAIKTTVLGAGETIHNSFSTTVDGRAAVATDHALYLLKKDEQGRPVVEWRQSYERGFARKPGQLSWGTGATPTFFGPGDGTDYVTITDNADDEISLLVFDAGGDAFGGELICRHRLFGEGSSGSENSAIGIGRSVFVASTYGYPYPAVPEGAGPAVPKTADFKGGMARIDVRLDETGCDLVWENDLRSAAVPKLSIADELIYTVERRKAFLSVKGIVDSYHFTAVDAHSGDVEKQKMIGHTILRDTLQMAGNIGDDGVYWQGTLGGVSRIAPR